MRHRITPLFVKMPPILALLVCLVGIYWPLQAMAQSLMIFDCQGFTRAIQKVQPNTGSRLELQIQGVDATKSSQVTITNNLTGEALSAPIQNGTAVFTDVPAGSFTVGATGANTSLGVVSIAPMSVSTAAASVAVGTAAVAGGGAAAGATVVIDDTFDLGVTDSNSGDDSPPVVEPAPDPITPDNDPPPSEPPPAEPPPSGGDDGSACTQCDPEATPPDLSGDDFFGQARLMSPSS